MCACTTLCPPHLYSCPLRPAVDISVQDLTIVSRLMWVPSAEPRYSARAASAISSPKRLYLKSYVTDKMDDFYQSLDLFYFMYVSVLPTCIYVCHACAYKCL